MSPEKLQSFASISLTRSTISDLAANIDGQLKEKVAYFVAFSVAILESTDIADIAQLAIFIRGVDASLTFTEEFVQFVPITGMTKAEYTFCSHVGVLDIVGVDWVCVVSVTTDGAPSMPGKKAGVVAKLKEKVHAVDGGLGLMTFHCIIHIVAS